ncbi:uncharacterized protein LOC111601744 [Drosophila hydei]|uniref:Uncharacterized protein LOC111601744 n=1 Tax=Drosophila hydei TaxID=7224 RepID=A0A6J1MBA4_DROHY|nr:uncharacterized protein LOC111601744 [Drosophila hydei]
MTTTKTRNKTWMAFALCRCFFTFLLHTHTRALNSQEHTHTAAQNFLLFTNFCDVFKCAPRRGRRRRRRRWQRRKQRVNERARGCDCDCDVGAAATYCLWVKAICAHA